MKIIYRCTIPIVILVFVFIGGFLFQDNLRATLSKSSTSEIPSVELNNSQGDTIPESSRIIGDTPPIVTTQPSVESVVPVENGIGEMRQDNTNERVVKDLTSLPAKIIVWNDDTLSTQSAILLERDLTEHRLIDEKYRGEVFDIQFSPDGSLISVMYIAESDQYSGRKYGSRFTSVLIIDSVYPYKVREFISPGRAAHTNLKWSLDSKFVTYTLNDGESQIIRRVADGEVVLTQKSGPLVWLDVDTFSYIQNGNIYSSKITEQNPKIILSGAVSSLGVFEGPSIGLTPLWSPDRRYVSYYSTSSLQIYDTVSKKGMALGRYDILDESYSATSIGWYGDDFYFTDRLSNSPVSIVELPEEKIISISISDHKGITGEHSISSNGKYIVAPGTYTGEKFIVYDPQKNQEVCENLEISHVYYKNDSWNGDYVLVYPLTQLGSTDESAKKATLIADISSCEIVGSLPFEADSALFGIN
jgi:hypothetical protein